MTSPGSSSATTDGLGDQAFWFGLVDLGPQSVEGEAEDVGYGGDGGEGWGGYAAGLYFAEGFGGDAGVEGGLEHGAVAAGAAEEGAEAFAALDLRGGEREPDHDPMIVPG